MNSLLLFCLDNYFKKTNKYYYFFDGMFKYKNILKKEILIDLKIPASTYRLNRIIDNAKNDNHISLLKYFNVDTLDTNIQLKYEMLLSRLYMAIYYKYDIQECYDKLEEYINQNNYLKPIFVLFRILYKMNSNKSYINIMEEIKEDVDYIFCFPREYFENELEPIFLNVLLFTKKSNVAIYDKTCYSKYPNFLWMYYHIMGTNAYTNKDYSKAILFYEEASKLYFKDSNVKRYLASRMNLTFMYNALFLPQLAIEVIYPILNYILNNETVYFFSKNVVLHYIMSLFMLEDYKGIIMFNEMHLLNNDNFKVRVSVIAVIASCYFENYNKDMIDTKLIEFCDLTRKFYDYIYNNIELDDDSKKTLLSAFYLKRIYEKAQNYKLKLPCNQEIKIWRKL